MAEIFAPRLIARLEPWLTADLERLAKALGHMFDPVLELSEEEGEDGFVSLDNNLLPNSGFEQGLSGWTTPSAFAPFIAPAKIARTTKQAFSGEASLEVVATEAQQGVTAAVPGTFISGQHYNASVYLKGAAGGEKVQLALGVSTDDEVLGAQELSTAWKRVNFTWTPKSTLTGVKFTVERTGAGTTTLFADAAMVVPGTTPIRYEPEQFYRPAYGDLLEAETCPARDLPYLAQYVGVVIPPGATEAEARSLVKAESGLERGTRQALEAAIKRVLGSAPFTLQERTNAKGEVAAYAFSVIVGPGGKTQALEEAIFAAKPAGLVMTVVEGKILWAQGGKKWSEVTAGKKWSNINEAEY